MIARFLWSDHPQAAELRAASGGRADLRQAALNDERFGTLWEAEDEEDTSCAGGNT
jgi:hypothetical protein